MLSPTTKTEIWCASLGEPSDAEKRDDARTNTYAGRPSVLPLHGSALLNP